MRILYILYILDLFNNFLANFGCMQSKHVCMYYIHVYMYVCINICMSV